MDSWNDDLEHTVRSEAEESESDAAKLAKRARALGDVAFDAMTRGDLLAVASSDRSYVGTVRYARGDLVSLETDGGWIDANLVGPLHLVIRRRAYSDGFDRVAGADTFKARLSEYELTGELVEIVAPHAGVSMKGHISAVAKDHLMLTTADGQDVFVPLSQIAFVVRPKS
ncbi:MAG: hypothetical protein GWP04_02695 [Gammaproteobacteria bacterium]|nr:hypothetical protein [Gammaproteobacteria bacterium]